MPEEEACPKCGKVMCHFLGGFTEPSHWECQYCGYLENDKMYIEKFKRTAVKMATYQH